MLSRRDLLVRAGAVGIGALIQGGDLAFAKAAQPSERVNFQVPAGACDVHTHIFGDAQRFPFKVPRGYTPEPASVEEMRAVHRVLRTDRVVLVQPSVYGSDNSCMIDAIKQLGRNARGIGVIDDDAPGSLLHEMNRAGIRGIRANFDDSGQLEPSVCRPIFQAKVERIKRQRNWHLQLHTRLSVIEGIKDLVIASPVPIVIDHFCEAKAPLGVGQPGFDTLLDLVRTGKVYVKVSAPYHGSTKPPDYPDAAPLAQALIAANPQRILWGSDWPHPANVQPKYTDISPLRQIDDAHLFNQFAMWAPDAAVRKTILVENPARLFGF